MTSDTTLLTFVAAALVVAVVPGPGVVYVVARSVTQGRQAGLVSAFGLSAGAFVHVAAAAAGLSAILLSSATAFNIVKFLGACYLVYLGIRTIFSARPAINVDTPAPLSLFRLLTEGVIVSIFNPKIAVFFLAFLPQFVEVNQGPTQQQFLLLGFIYVAIALTTDSVYALMAGGLRHWLTERIMQGPLPRYVSGGLYFGLGLNTALTGRRL